MSRLHLTVSLAFLIGTVHGQERRAPLVTRTHDLGALIEPLVDSPLPAAHDWGSLELRGGPEESYHGLEDFGQTLSFLESDSTWGNDGVDPDGIEEFIYTGIEPGRPRQTGHTLVLGSSPNWFGQPQNSFVAVASSVWTSSPITIS